MLIRICAHEQAYSFAPACEYGDMHVTVCGVCVGVYSDNNQYVCVDLQLLACGQHGAKK